MTDDLQADVIEFDEMVALALASLAAAVPCRGRR